MLLFWQACSNQLQKELTPQQFKAWIAPLTVCAFDEQSQSLTIGAPSRIKAEACSRQFGQRIQMLAQEYWGKTIQVQFTVRDKSSQKASLGVSAVVSVTAAPTANHPAPSTEPPTLNSVREKSEKAEKAVSKETKLDTTYKNNHLDKNLNFDTLVTGNANQMARMVGLEVINQLGKRYNPFFIYGGVGVGKTHLMQAIGNEVYKLDPSKKIRYLFANTYVSEVVKAYQKNQFEEFKNYYHNLDLLLIDDIQFFGEGDKSGTQGAFFELFESLIRNKKQIIMTSDRYPQS